MDFVAGLLVLERGNFSVAENISLVNNRLKFTVSFEHRQLIADTDSTGENSTLIFLGHYCFKGYEDLHAIKIDLLTNNLSIYYNADHILFDCLVSGQEIKQLL